MNDVKVFYSTAFVDSNSKWKETNYFIVYDDGGHILEIIPHVPENKSMVEEGLKAKYSNVTFIRNWVKPKIAHKTISDILNDVENDVEKRFVNNSASAAPKTIRFNVRNVGTGLLKWEGIKWSNGSVTLFAVNASYTFPNFNDFYASELRSNIGVLDVDWIDNPDGSAKIASKLTSIFKNLEQVRKDYSEVIDHMKFVP